MKEDEDEDYFEEGKTGEFHEVDEEYLYYNGEPDREDNMDDETDEEYAYRMEETTGDKRYHYTDDTDDEECSSGWEFIIFVIFVLYYLFS